MSNNITNTEAANYILEVMSKEIIRDVNPKMVLAPLVKRFDKEAKGTNSIRIPSLANLTANDKVAEMDVTPQAPTEGKTDFAIDTHKEVSFIVEDFTELQTSRSLSFTQSQLQQLSLVLWILLWPL